MKHRVNREGRNSDRVIFSLPTDLVAELRQFADIYRGGNKSGFVADAVRSYIDHLRRMRHTAKLRESYAAAAANGLAITRDWQATDDELWAKMDALEARTGKAK